MWHQDEMPAKPRWNGLSQDSISDEWELRSSQTPRGHTYMTKPLGTQQQETKWREGKGSENTGHWQAKERTVSLNTKPESRICGPGEPRRELQKRGSKLSSLSGSPI